MPEAKIPNAVCECDKKKKDACKLIVVLPCPDVNGPIGVNVNPETALFAIQQTGTFTFLHKFKARKTENCRVFMQHAVNTFTYRIYVILACLYLLRTVIVLNDYDHTLPRNPQTIIRLYITHRIGYFKVYKLYLVLIDDNCK